MICWGKTKQGKQRYRCSKCFQTAIKKRPDQSKRRIKILFDRYILGSKSILDISKETRVSKRTISRHFEKFWKQLITPRPIKENIGLVLDATTIVKREVVVLIAYDPIKQIVVSWQFVPRETYFAWSEFIKTLPKPQFVVSDAQKGLIRAVREVFPGIKHQRCLIHIIRRSNAWLTKNPQTKVGLELRNIVRLISQIKNQEHKESWIRMFNEWNFKYKDFLNEKKQSPYSTRKWFVHRKIRGIRSMVINSLPYLFSFLDNQLIPKTSNCVEGGINSPIKDLIRKHRGLIGKKKIVLVANYLKKRQVKIPTLNVY
jgi:transposase